MSVINAAKILSAATATGTGGIHSAWTHRLTYSATGFTTAGAGAVAVQIWVSNVDAPSTANDTDWGLLGSIALVLSTTTTSDGFATEAAWKWRRAKVTAISGTGASVDVYMGGALIQY